MLWFQHMHKCMGSSIVLLAKQEDIRLYPHNLNGNPHYLKTLQNGTLTWGDHIPFWDFDSDRLSEFIQECKNKFVQLICSESGFPNIDQLSKIDGVTFLTALRDPFSRLVSNFRYDYQERNTRSKTLAEYYKSTKESIVQPNYYTNLLSQGSGNYQTAVKMLNVFNVILIQEHQETFKLLKRIGFKGTPPVFNNCGYSDNKTIAAENYEFFKNVFRPENENDYKLYELAKEISFGML